MPTERRAFFFDVDNTLIDNDAAKVELRLRLVDTLGARETARFWTLYEVVRRQQGFVSIPLTLDRFAAERAASPGPMSTSERAALAAIFSDFPFADFLFPDSLRVLARLQQHGLVAIFSDGDPVFQPRKIWRAGLLAAVDGAVMVFTDKTRRLREAAAFYPADHYVVVDDKPAVLREARQELGARATTVHVGHGHYAATISAEEADAIDLRLRGIGELPAALGFGDAPEAPAEERPAPVTEGGIETT